MDKLIMITPAPQGEEKRLDWEVVNGYPCAKGIAPFHYVIYQDPFNGEWNAAIESTRGSWLVLRAGGEAQAKDRCLAHHEDMRDVVAAATADKGAEIAKLKAKVNVPGVWKCHTCNFVNHRNTIHPNGIFADTKILEEPCPNDGDVMFPMTWEEMARENQDFGVKLMEREASKDALLRELVKQLERIRLHTPHHLVVSIDPRITLIDLVDTALQHAREKGVL